MPPAVRRALRRDAQIDFSYILEGVGRFRVNAFHQRGTPSIVFRHVKDRPPTFEQLNHQAETFVKLCSTHEGIVLVCGPPAPARAPRSPPCSTGSTRTWTSTS
jgi:twitching motility protein PilT